MSPGGRKCFARTAGSCSEPLPPRSAPLITSGEKWRLTPSQNGQKGTSSKSRRDRLLFFLGNPLNAGDAGGSV